MPGQAVDFETYKTLRAKGLSDDQIDRFFQGEVPAANPKQINYNKIEQDQGPQLKSDSTAGRLTRGFLQTLPTTLSIGGEYVGGPIGSGVGAAVGEGIASIPRFASGDPDLMKDAAVDIMREGAEGFGISKAAPFISKGLSRGKDFLMDKLTSFPIHGDPLDLKSAVDSGIPMSVGQTTGSPLPKFLERAMAPFEEKQALENSQKSFLDDLTGKFRVRFADSPTAPVRQTAEHLGQQAQDTIKTNIDQLTSKVDQAYNRVKFDARANAFDIPVKVGEEPTGVLDATGKMGVRPIYENTRVEGPIAYGKTFQFVKKIKPKIDELYEETDISNPLKSRLAALRQAMNSLAEGTGGLPIKDWETIKEFRTVINGMVADTPKLNRGEGGLAKIAQLLGEDIDQGVKLWEKNSPGAYKRLKAANALAEEKATTFTDRVRKSTLGDSEVFPNADASAVFDKARSNPEAAAEMMKALGPKGQSAMKGQFFEDLVKDGNPTKALDILADADSAHRKVFSSAERADLVDFFRTMRRVETDKSHAGDVSLAMRKASIGLTFGGGMLDYLTGDSLPGSGIGSRYAYTGAAVLIGGKQFAEKILLNPRYARSASRLAKLAPNSKEAEFLRKSILTALRGTEATIELADGSNEEATITASGKLKIKQ